MNRDKTVDATTPPHPAVPRSAEFDLLKRVIVQTAMDGFWITGPDGRILEVNDAYCELSGYTRAELLGMSISDLDAAETPEETLRHVKMIFAEGRDRFESRHRRKGGAVYDVEVSVQYVPHDGGLLVVFIRDITGRKRLEERLLQAQKMEAMGRLTAGIAHDFNNILSVINSYSGLVLDDLPPDSPSRRDLEEVVNAGRRAAALTRQLLLFSRQQALEARPIEIDDLVREMERMLRRIISEDITLAAVLDARAATVVGDRGQLEQVLMNLVVNARDAMPRGGALTVRTDVAELDADGCAGIPDATPGRFVRLSVQDTGTGMDRETMAHIFEPFFTTKGHGKGTGLGLSTVYGIVRHHGGFVRVDSEPGAGTTFSVYLPVPGAGAEHAPRAAEDAPADPAAPQGSRSSSPAGTPTIASS